MTLMVLGPRIVMRALAIAALAATGCGDRTGLAGDTTGPLGGTADSGAHDAPFDQGLDVRIPEGCGDAGATLIYLLGQNDDLYSFDPSTLESTHIGKLGCGRSTSTPWSMAVDRRGFAYSVFFDGHLYKVNVADASCVETPYVPGQDGFVTFGMGYVHAPDGTDTLYVAQADFTSTSKGLGLIDTTSLTLNFVGSFDHDFGKCELTGTGDGRLFMFCLPVSSVGSTLARIDPTDAHVIAADHLRVGSSEDANAFGFWGGKFWIFTSPGTDSAVTVFDPADGSETTVATVPDVIVGAGVSTCAPL